MNGHFEASVVLVKAGGKFLHLSSLYICVVLSKDVVIVKKGSALADVFSLQQGAVALGWTRSTAGPAERPRENCL